MRPTAPAGRPWTREDHIAKSCRDAVRGRHGRSRPPAACKAFFNRLLPQQALFLTYTVCVEVKCLGGVHSSFCTPQVVLSPFPVVGHAWEGAWGAKGGPGALRLRPSTLRAVAGNSTALERALHIVTKYDVLTELGAGKDLTPARCDTYPTARRQGTLLGLLATRFGHPAWNRGARRWHREPRNF